MKPRLLYFLLMGMAVACLSAEDLSPRFIDQHQDQLDRLFAELDTGHASLRPLIVQWNEGERFEAAVALADYFANKTIDLDLLETISLPGKLEEQTEAALSNTFFLLGQWATVPTTSTGGLDWEFGGDNDDKEWAWMLNRHAFLPELTEAFRRTGDAVYRNQLNKLWQDWVTNSPYPNRLTFSPQWRPLEVARRLNNSWIHTFYNPEILDSGTRLLVLASIADHADALRNHASFWGGNHLITEKLALLTLTIAWPEFADAPEWQAHAIDKVSGQIMDQTYPDGSYMELSNHYQRVVLLNCQHFLRLLATVESAYRESPVYERIVTMWEFFAGVMRPDGTGPINNASDRENNAGYLEEVWEFHKRPDWLAMASNGAHGKLPMDSPSRLYPWAGQVILRNNWGPRADWIYFDAGPYGTAHQHVDHFHVSASLDGRSILTDSGRFTYKPGIWRDYFKGPSSHSTILLDGQAPDQGARKISKPLSVQFHETESVVLTGSTTRFLFDGTIPGFKTPVPWTRAILYDKRGFVILIDHLVTFQKHALQASWHFHPDMSDEEASHSLQLAHPVGKVKSVLQRGSESDPMGGFFSPDYNEKHPAALLRFIGQIDRPTTYIWTLKSPGKDVVNIQLLSQEGAPVLHLRVSLGTKPVGEAKIQLYPAPELLEYEVF